MIPQTVNSDDVIITGINIFISPLIIFAMNEIKQYTYSIINGIITLLLSYRKPLSAIGTTGTVRNSIKIFKNLSLALAFLEKILPKSAMNIVTVIP